MTDIIADMGQRIAALEEQVERLLRHEQPATTTTTREGLIELATQAEVDARTDAIRAVTPATLPTASARVHHNTSQSIPNSFQTILAFNRERFDTDSIHDNVTNNSRLTCKTAGKYIIVGNVQYSANATGIRQVNIRYNGSTIIAVEEKTNSGVYTTTLIVTCIYVMSVNDYVEIGCYQNSGGALNIINSSQFSPEFMMAMLP